MNRVVRYALLCHCLVRCGGEPFALSSTTLDDAGEGGRSFASDRAIPLPAQTDGAAGDAEQLHQLEAAAGGDAEFHQVEGAAAGDAEQLHQLEAAAGDVMEAGVPCDPSYGDASPGGPCCVHVWATPTMGAVLCTVDGSRWCWQSGMPCSPPGSRCVTQNGVIYCAP